MRCKTSSFPFTCVKKVRRTDKNKPKVWLNRWVGEGGKVHSWGEAENKKSTFWLCEDEDGAFGKVGRLNTSSPALVGGEISLLLLFSALTAAESTTSSSI